MDDSRAFTLRMSEGFSHGLDQIVTEGCVANVVEIAEQRAPGM